MEKELTPQELSFLYSQGRGPEDVFDGRGMAQWWWMEQAKKEGKDIVLGTPCRRAGHRLRTRKGHCVQCDTSKLAYLTRHSSEQYVYIAGSRSAKLIKIGTCVHCGQREHQLRAEKYGGTGDWEIIYCVKVRNAGDVEHAARSKLRSFIVSRPYWKNGNQQAAWELLRCSFKTAREALEGVSANARVGEPWKQAFTYMYNFDFSEGETRACRAE